MGNQCSSVILRNKGFVVLFSGTSMNEVVYRAIRLNFVTVIYAAWVGTIDTRVSMVI